MPKVILPPPRPSELGWPPRLHRRRKIRKGTALVRDGLADAGRALWHGAAAAAAALGSRAGVLSRSLVPRLTRRLHL